VLALLPFFQRLVLSLPHPLFELWVLWLFAVIFQLNYLFNKRRHTSQLSKSGEIMNFREIIAVGCLGGFILLTFITAFCIYLIMKSKKLL
jgi:hypothetical protein